MAAGRSRLVALRIAPRIPQGTYQLQDIASPRTAVPEAERSGKGAKQSHHPGDCHPSAAARGRGGAPRAPPAGRPPPRGAARAAPPPPPPPTPPPPPQGGVGGGGGGPPPAPS